MGRGLFFSHLKDMENHNIRFRVRNRKKQVEGVLMSWNLQPGEGLYAFVELKNNKELKLFTPKDQIHDVTILGKVETCHSLEKLSEEI